jgi:hypothetical protein
MTVPRKGQKVTRGYATVFEDDGADYRTISKLMTEAGFKCNHTSARNYVLRVMKKFAEAYLEKMNVELTEDRIKWICRDPNFQSAISELVQNADGQQ